MNHRALARFWQTRPNTQHREMSCKPAIAHRSRSSSAGFTLVEMMIIVVIVGVLATLATYGVIKYVRSSRTSEAFAMLIDIKSAEETVRDETFAYVGLNDFTEWHPTDPPGNFKADWNVQFSNASTKFRELGVVSTGPVYFTYTVVAGTGGAVPALPTKAQKDFAPNGPWYVAVARGDLDGDGEYSYIVGTSFGSDLFVEQEGE